MTTFKEQLAEDTNTVLLNTDEHAEWLTYTPLGGSASQVKATIERDPRQVMNWTDGTGDKTETDIHIRNDADGGVLDPSPRDQVTFDGFDWYIKEITGPHVDNTWIIKVCRITHDRRGNATMER